MIPKDFAKEDKDFAEDVGKFCEMTKFFAQRYSPQPNQHLEPKEYLITVPLKSPYQDIQALLWSTTSLDDAIDFITLLQGGNLKALKVYPQRFPGGQGPPRGAPHAQLRN